MEQNENNTPELEVADEVEVTTNTNHISKKIIIAICFVLTILISVGSTLLCVKMFAPKTTSSKLDEINSLVHAYYDGKIDEELIEDTLATAYMYALGDKYGFYKNTEDTLAVIDSFEGNAAGIGVSAVYEEETGGLYIVRIDDNSPADKAELQVGDVITAIDGQKTADLGYEGSFSAIKRQKGEMATITYIRGGKESKTKVKYDEYVSQSVYYEKIQDVGYICFTSFNDATVEQFEKALETLQSQKVKGLIFDVRNNGGGTVDAVCEILDILVGKCDLMTVQYADKSRVVTHNSDSDEVNLPMAVLVNGNTASASELFAATLRNVKNAPLIGAKTYGKGVVQRTYYLSDDSCVRFTIGKFYPAKGDCFNEVGLTPDHQIIYTEEQIKNSYKLGHNDPHIVKALECLK